MIMAIGERRERSPAKRERSPAIKKDRSPIKRGERERSPLKKGDLKSPIKRGERSPGKRDRSPEDLKKEVRERSVGQVQNVQCTKTNVTRNTKKMETKGSLHNVAADFRWPEMLAPRLRRLKSLRCPSLLLTGEVLRYVYTTTHTNGEDQLFSHREKTCPLLLRVFCSQHRHNNMSEYMRGNQQSRFNVAFTST